MSFTPFARYRNFTLDNLKSILAVYPDMERSLSWSKAKDLIETKLSGYKKTAYQQACQFGLEDRTADYFRIHNYLYTFDDDNLKKYLVFWFKTYFAPNPYVKSPDHDEPFIIYAKLCEEIIGSPDGSVSFEKFFSKYIGGKSNDILLNGIKSYASPIKYKRIGEEDVLYIAQEDADQVKREIDFINKTFPIGDATSEHDFFERYSYVNFCRFYNIEIDPAVKDGEKRIIPVSNRTEIPFEQSKEAARLIIDTVYDADGFSHLKNILENNEKNVKIKTDDLGGNYLRYAFVKNSSGVFDNPSGGKNRVFTDKTYVIPFESGTEKCRLSTEWVSSDIGSLGTSANYLQALIKKVNDSYAGIIHIFEQNGKWYLEKLVQKFEFNQIPETFQNDFARRYITSLLAKPFVILTGNSGTGKTRISKQFAEYLEEKSDNDEKNWVLVPVGADWTDNTKVLGFYNPLGNEGRGEYKKTDVLKLIERANLPENADKPFFLILDEMNLSRVEVLCRFSQSYGDNGYSICTGRL